MGSQLYFVKIVWMLLLLQLVAARTVLHRRTEIDSNGEEHTKTWSTQEPDEDFPTPIDGSEDNGFQTFTRNGVTLRIKPQITTLRIGGKNISPDQLLEQAKHAKDLELIAVRQLLSTGHPVKRTNIENGRKHTSTYTLEPDGSILCKKVEDIDMADVDRRFEEIFKQRTVQNPNKLSGDWEWAGDDKSKEVKEVPVHDEPKILQQPSQASKPVQPNPKASQAPTPAPAPVQPPKPQQSAQSPTPDRNIFGGAPTFGQYPKLPNTWDSDTWDKRDPFNPPELPSFGGFSDDFEYDPSDESTVPKTQTNTFTNTQTDKDGSTVHTSYTTGPNEWKRKTVKISTNYQPIETTEESTTIQTRTVPSLEDFLQSQYNPATWSTSTTPKTIKTINIEDLPPVGVININKPIEEQFLQPLGPSAGNQKPEKTLKVENILPSPDIGDQRIERTKIRTFTKTVHGNQAPSSADLDPNMLDILQRAGIKPEDITNANGQTITKTRIEPDGRIVKTTYRVSPTYDINGYNFISSTQPNFGAPFPESTFAVRRPYDRPSIFSEPLPSKHHSASRFGIDFTPFAATNPKPAIRDREPLEPQDEDEEEASTLNPLLIHPVNALAPVGASGSPSNGLIPKQAKSAIAEFLAKIGLSVNDLTLQNGEFVKTIVDDDGRVLTAKFVLSAPVGSKYDK